MEVRTRSGRVSKPPDRYQPVEEVTDDYADDDYDDVDDEESEYEEETDDEDDDDEDDDDDADENGNLKGFVVDDEELEELEPEDEEA
jgi:hypothetical protein